WNRVGSDGRPRELHIQQGLDAIDYDLGPIHPQTPQSTERPFVERLVACDKFVLDRWRFHQAASVGGDDRFHILAVLSGAVTLAGDPAGKPLSKGEIALIPAACGSVDVVPQGETTLLETHLP